MSDSFRFELVDDFTTGTVGPAGARVFYVQIAVGGSHLTFKAEKAQVAALSTSLRQVLEDLQPTGGQLHPPGELREPIAPAWAIAGIGLAYDDGADRLVVHLEELVDDEEAEGATAQFRITRAMAEAFCEHADAVVTAGRPPCRWCGRPIDPTGHACPRMN